MTRSTSDPAPRRSTTRAFDPSSNAAGRAERRAAPGRASAIGAACVALVATAPASALAQAGAPAALERVIVTGNPLGNADPISPVTVLEGDGLVLRRGSSLGATLDGLPGVASTRFGPNANRPVVRGLDGDRVRILSNAGASLDASSLSFDHAVPIDPLVVERIEVLRGPGALQYGGSALGGVVNTIDNRIPRSPMQGTSGALELRLGGADRERGVSALVETGNQHFGLHVDAAGRRTADLRVPDFQPPVADDGSLPARRGRIVNSAGRTSSGAVGGSMFFERGYLGVAVDRHDSRYGIVVEPDVTIDMKREHLGLAGEWRAGAAGSVLGFDRLTAQVNRTLYQHQEIEGSGDIGTTFATTGSEARLEARHVPLLRGLSGVVGLQWEDADFSALGAEAFVPSTRTRKRALFVVEELGWAGGRLSAGLRAERVRVDSAGDADPAAAQFGAPASRRFSLGSASLGNLSTLGGGWSFSTSLSASERAPTSFELYANGVHAATAAFERGDPGLSKERGRNLDLALSWASGHSRVRVGGFVSRYSRFISLEETGAQVAVPNEEGGVDDIPEFVFRPVRARLWGVELEAGHRLQAAGWQIDASAQLDLTRARNADTGAPLPRVAPRRLRGTLAFSRADWHLQLELVNAARQDRVPVTDTATPGYRLFNLALSRKLRLGGGGQGGGSGGGTQALWFVKLDNAGNRLAYSASAVQTVRGLSPLPGRSLQTGLRLDF